MYSWTALVTSQILIEIPWNLLGSTLLFLCWYWPVGLHADRAGYTYLMLGIVFPCYYTTIGQVSSFRNYHYNMCFLTWSVVLGCGLHGA